MHQQNAYPIETRDEPAAVDFDQQTFGTDYHIAIELPISGCKADLEDYITELFKEPYSFLIIEHEVNMYCILSLYHIIIHDLSI